VTPLTEHDKATAPSYQLDLLEIFHRYNTNLQNAEKQTGGGEALPMKPIPLGLVLRDRVKEDQNVYRIQQLVQDNQPSIRLLVPSFKFASSWYHEIFSSPILSRLPLTVWTVDEPQDYDYATKMNVSGVIANRPMDFCCNKNVIVEQIVG
jgi:hypothetical protein